MSKLLEPIFKKEELHYCSVPVPEINAHKGADFNFTNEQINGYGQGQTHPSIVYVEGGWNGHEYWMAATPYANAIAVFENPCIYYGDADENGNPPRVFHPINGTANGEYTMVNNPVVKVTSNKDINSDPDLLFDETTRTMYLISRWNTEPYEKFPTYVQKSVDGQSWTPRPITPIIDGDTTFGSAQPSFVKVGDEYRIYGSSGGYQYRDDSVQGQGYNAMGITAGSSLDAPFTFKKYCYFGGKRNIDPYHSDVFIDPKTGKFYAIYCASNYNLEAEIQKPRWVYLAESEDGENFHVFARPLLSDYGTGMAYYRPTACVRNSDRTLIVYWSTVAGISKDPADYPNGESDVPVDDRAIGLSYGNFDAILTVLKQDVVTI